MHRSTLRRCSLAGATILALALTSAQLAVPARADTPTPPVAAADSSVSAIEIASAVQSADSAVAEGVLEDASSQAASQPSEEKVATSTAEKATAPVDVEQAGDSYQVDSKEGLDVSAPHDPTNPVVATDSDGFSIEVTLPQAEHLSDAKVAGDGATVIYTGDASVPSVAVQSSAGGLRIHSVIAGPDVDSDSTYSLGLAEGGQLIQDESGFVLIKAADGSTQGFISPAWAVDATGVSLPTWYTISGSIITQHVDLTGQGIQYPVVADPWLGQDLVSSAKWVHSSSGWTLQVTPTGFARTIMPIFKLELALWAGYAGWDELYAKYKKKGLNTNLGGMKDQYVCHMQFAFFKSTWNLDEWRPNVSYLATVAAACNPK